MPVALSLSLTLIMCAVLIVSGISKLRHPADLQGWSDLGVPAALRKRSMVRLHPWGEIIIGVAMVLFGGMLEFIAAVAAALLMVIYTVIVARALARNPNVVCACFGKPAPLTRRTLSRNLWLTIVAIGTTVSLWLHPLYGGAAALAVAYWGVTAGLLVVAITVTLIVRSNYDLPVIGGGRTEPAEAVEREPVHDPLADAAAEEAASGGRAPIPTVTVALADGSPVSLPALVGRRPVLLLAVSESPGVSATVVGTLDQYRSLLPDVDVRLLLELAPQDSRLTSFAEPQSLHDPEGRVTAALGGLILTPSAVLLGSDGLVAAGPVSGADAIGSLVYDLHQRQRSGGSVR